jgi:hypothetical protein
MMGMSWCRTHHLNFLIDGGFALELVSLPVFLVGFVFDIGIKERF